MKQLLQTLVASLILPLATVYLCQAQTTCPADRSVCANEAPFALAGGSPSGGTYSGPGVSGGIFSPEIAGTGPKTITYTNQNGGSTTTCTFTITVNPAPVALYSLGIIPICINDTPGDPAQYGTLIPFSTTPAEPISVDWSGPGISGSAAGGYLFTPADAGTGMHNVFATATTSHGCISGPHSNTIVVDGESAVSCPKDMTISIFDAAFKLSGAKNITVSGLPALPGQAADAGGTYSGVGVNSATSIFTPSIAGEGVHQITYTVADGCGPVASCSFNINTSTLPVKLLSFGARKNENKILLSWQTSEETNFDRFEIEKSQNPKKGFVKIGSVSGHGTANAYNFLDQTGIAPGTQFYYRLKMIDSDGTYAYSKIVWELVNGGEVITVYPNPVSSELSVVSQSDLVDIQLINSKGITVVSHKQQRSKVINLDVSRLLPGTYVVRTKDIYNHNFKSKIIIQR